MGYTEKEIQLREDLFIKYPETNQDYEHIVIRLAIEKQKQKASKSSKLTKYKHTQFENGRQCLLMIYL